MEVNEAIKERRSVREFQDEPVSEGDLEQILDAARWAPSSGNTQPLEMVVIRERGKKRQLARAALGRSFVAEAPVVIVVCADVRRTEGRYGRRGEELYAIQDAAAATQNILLTAQSLGYATCWVGAFDDEKVAEAIDAPDRVRPFAIVPLGVPAEEPAAPDRRSLEEITHEDTFSG